MATIRKRRAKWHVQVRRSGQSRTRSFCLKADAEVWARKTEREIDTEDLMNVSDRLSMLTLADLLKKYLREVIPLKRSAGSVEGYIVKRYLDHEISALSLNCLTAEAINQYKQTRLSIVKGSTLLRELGVLRHCLEVARKDWGIPLKDNPVVGIRMPSPGKSRDRRVTKDELTSLNRHCSHPLLWQIINIAIETAMRRGEIVAMQWDHIDWDKRILHIPDTKNGHPRTIPLTPTAMRVLKELPRINSDVIGMSGNAIRLAWERLKKKAGVTDLRFHDLRHEAISRFFEMGLSVPEVALISGHRDPRMLFRYTHLRAEEVGKKFSDAPSLSPSQSD